MVSPSVASAEINAAWEIDSASSYEAKKQLYGDDGPEGYLEKLKAGAEVIPLHGNAA